MAGVLHQGWHAFPIVSQRQLARLLQDFERGTRERKSRGLEGLSALASRACLRPPSFNAVLERELRVLREDSARQGKTQTTLEALYRRCRWRPGRGSWPGVCRQVFSSRSQAAGLKNREGNSGSDGTGYQRLVLDVGHD